MLHLPPPHPMPHAIPPDPRPSYPSKYSHSRLPDPDRPSHRSSSVRPFAPTTEMSSILGTSYGGPRAGDAALYSHNRHEPSTYGASSNPLAHRGSSQSKHAVDGRGSPIPHRPLVPPNVPETAKPANSAVAPSLQIPSTIHTPQISLPQLAAEVTCLFWFENSSLLKQIEDPRSAHMPVTPLVPDAIPSTGFRKWATTILSTTQVTQNVILLALLFIYRLKDINPSVKGKPGSEFRLFTVALMLGNKFLDDNTYTNKTWAEVSGISVQEVHIMEVEFLSNMRYSLFTSKASWDEWHVKLGKFGTYFDRATRPADSTPRFGSLATPTLQMPPALSSPPTSSHTSLPYPSSYSPSYPSRSNTPLILPQLGSTVVSPIGPLPELDPRAGGRKRSYDEQVEEPVPKRIQRAFTYQLPPLQSPCSSSSSSSTAPNHQTYNFQRLPLPNLSIPSYSGSSAPVRLAPQLPPPGGKAMSLVYPPTAQWSHAPSLPMTTSAMPPAIQPFSNGALGDLSRQLSPFPVNSAGSSPVSASHAPSSHLQSQNHLSPSYFLAQRNSPYRPVRRVNTLLYPPPSASMQNAPKHVGYDQMQYQPLGKPVNERKVGHLPYMHQEAWPATNQFNQWSSISQAGQSA